MKREKPKNSQPNRMYKKQTQQTTLCKFLISLTTLLSLQKKKKNHYFTSRFNIFQIQATIFNLLFPITYVSGIYVINPIKA